MELIWVDNGSYEEFYKVNMELIWNFMELMWD